MEYYLAADIGGTFVKFGLADEDGRIHESGREPVPQNLPGLLALISRLNSQYPDAAGLAVSSPGAVGPDGVVYGSSALPYLHGPNMGELFEKTVNKPVFLENDANCAALAELWKGAGRKKKDFMVMVIGTGIGGAVIKDRQLHKGARLHGGEFGYMLLDSHFTGNDDIWSRRASTAALIRNAARRKQLQPDQLTGERIFELAEDGDQDCLAALDEFYSLLAAGIYNLQYIYDPEIILIGGGISARSELIPAIDAKLGRIMDTISLAKIKPAIAACQFRQDANLIGAVYGCLTMKTVL